MICKRLEKLIPNDAARRAACEQGLDRWYSAFMAADTDINLSDKREKGAGAMSEIRCAIEIREDDDDGRPRIFGVLS